MSAFSAVFAQRHPYHNPTGREFPILAWYSIMGEENLTPARYQELRDAGFNISFSHFTSENQLKLALEACKGTGVKLLASADTASGKIDRFKNDESLAGWFLVDEPAVKDYPALRKMRDYIYAADTAHFLYLNLLPSFVSPAVLGSKDYEDYVQRFVDEVQLPLISYDIYPIVTEGDRIVVRPQFYENLEIVRRVSMRSGVPFWAFVLSTQHDPYPLPTRTHLRYQAFSDLAYGAQCIEYFTYWRPDSPIWNFHNAPISKDGRKTHVYLLARELNREIQNLAWVFLGAKAVSVGHTGESIPQGATRLDSLPAPFRSVEADGQGLLVSHLKNGSKEFLMIFNRDLAGAQTVALKASGKLRQVMPDGTERKLSAKRLRPFSLAAGDYALFRFK